MILLPIVGRELRVTSRRAATYWTRFSAGSMAIIIGTIIWALSFREAPGKTGLTLFIAFGVIAYLYSLLSGAISTADSVSEEKREGTLGLLFLTDLKSYDVVSGKLVASSVTSLYGLLAFLPVMAVPLLMGGVALGEFWRVALVCLNLLFVSLSIGLLCSAICQDERKSIGLTLLVLILLTLAWPGLIAWVGSRMRVGNPLYDLFRNHPEPLLAPSPLLSCVFAFDQAYKAQIAAKKVNWFYISLGITHLYGWISILLTMFVLPRVWQDKAASAVGQKRRERWKLLTTGSPAARRAFRHQLLAINPFYWLASRDYFKTTLVWLSLGIGALLWMLGWARERYWLDQPTYVFTAVCAHSVFKCWMALEASRRLGADRQSGALELLLSTPLNVGEILRGQWLALRRQFGGAVAVICAVDLLFLVMGLKNTYNNDRDFWVQVCLAGIVVFVCDLVTLALLAMWLSLKTSKTTQAALSALARVCILPWVLFGAFGAGMVFLEEVLHIPLLRHAFSDESSFLTVWVLLSLGTDALFATWSLRNLKARFRSIASDRMDRRAGFWQRVSFWR